MELKPIFTEPQGSSRLRPGAFGWNIDQHAVDYDVVCGFCGTSHKYESGMTIIVGTLLGRVYVEDCCGAVVDGLYEKLGDIFAIQKLEDFERDPADTRIYAFKCQLYGTLVRASDKLRRLSDEITETCRKAFAQ